MPKNIKKKLQSRKIKKGGHLMLFEKHFSMPYPVGYFQTPLMTIAYTDSDHNNFIISLNSHAFKHLDSFKKFFTERVGPSQFDMLSRIYRGTVPLSAPNIPGGVPSVDAGQMTPYLNFVGNRLKDMELLLSDFNNAQRYPAAGNQFMIIKNGIRIVYQTNNGGKIPNQTVGAGGIGDYLFRLNSITTVDQYGNAPWVSPMGSDVDLENGTPTVNMWLYPQSLDPYFNRTWMDELREENETNQKNSQRQTELNEERMREFDILSPRENRPPLEIYPLEQEWPSYAEREARLRDTYNYAAQHAASVAGYTPPTAEYNPPPPPLNSSAQIFTPKQPPRGGTRNNKKMRKSINTRKSRKTKRK